MAGKKWVSGKQGDWNEEYNIMMLLIGSMKFTSWSILEQKVGRRSDWTAKQFKPWLKKERPGSLEQVEEVLKLQKGIRNVDDSVPGMADVLEWEVISSTNLVKLYRDSVLKQMNVRSNEKVKMLLDSMEDDLVATRAVTLQACMLAITGYFQSIQKRVKEGKEIYTKEFKTAYEIYKTEMGEPVAIKESRVKNLQVTLSVPVEKDEVEKILGNSPNQDLKIEVAEEFKDKVEEKFNLNQ